MENEVWKPVVGYEGLYMVSNYGRVWSVRQKKLMKPDKIITKSGSLYYKVNLYKDGERHTCPVHRLVAQAFIPNPDNLTEVNHKDENGLNNNVNNLEWCTRTYNNNYGTRIQRATEKCSKPVYQYTLDGKLIKEWPSTIEVQRQTGYSCGNISKCCNGKLKQAYGFIWRYKK